jgi:hypothetical protein
MFADLSMKIRETFEQTWPSFTSKQKMVVAANIIGA